MKKKNIRLMYLLALLQGMVFYAPIATLYRQAQGVSIAQITQIESLSLALSILLELPWGILADRIGYKRTMVFCSWLYFASKLVFWQASGFGGFLAERVMLSVVFAGLSGVDTTILYLSCKGDQVQKVFGIYESLGTAGLLAASVFFSALLQSNYRLAALLTAVSYGAAALLSLGLEDIGPMTARKPALESFGEAFRSTLRNKRLLLFLLAVALLSETHQTITVFLNQLKYQSCGLNDAAIGVLYTAATLLGLLGRFSWLVTRKMGTRVSLLLFAGTAAAACLTLALTGSAAPAVLGILSLRLSNCLFQPLQMLIQNQEVHTECRATALSIHAVITDGVAIGTNLLFGLLADFSLTSAFLFGFGISGLSILLLTVWLKGSRTSETI